MSPTLAVERIHKRFGSTTALSDVSLSVCAGEVVGLIGENGAGKSTLLNIVSGVLRPDSGDVLIQGRKRPRHYARTAALGGVFHIHQHLSLVPNLTVFENFYLAHENRFSRFGFIRNRLMKERAKAVLAEFGHDWIDPRLEVRTFDFATRQSIEILKAFALAELLEVDSPILLLDEPTAALSNDEVRFLASLIDSFRAKAATVFVSHRLNEVLSFSDRVYVLRDGEVTAGVDQPGSVSEDELHKFMVGRPQLEDHYHESAQRTPGEAVVLEAIGLSHNTEFKGINLSVREGEIVGIGGLLGSGKSSVARALIGATPATAGEVRVEGLARPASITSIIKAGVGYIPSDRQAEGVMGSLPVSWNISLSSIARGGFESIILDIGAEDRSARNYVRDLGIKTSSVRALVRTLSGGNQQKVLLARWLSSGARILILDNPTQGVDSGAKEEIYRALREVADAGVGILLVSDDLMELIGLSNRILVMRSGHVVQEIDSPPDAKPTEVQLVAEMV
jgi:ribose transport system ATP-binding protein